MTYTFKDQLRAGKRGEAILDHYFSCWFRVETIPVEIEQRIHADRLFIDGEGQQFTVEYKTDFMGHKTGNLVVEVMSNDVTHAPGWIYACKADRLVWWMAGSGELFVFRMADLVKELPRWLAACRKVQIPNDGYHTVGLLVPIPEIARLATWHAQLLTLADLWD